MLQRPSSNNPAQRELCEPLTKLAGEHERMARVCEFTLCAGMSSHEIAEVLGVSQRAVDTEWYLARKWLSREMRIDG